MTPEWICMDMRWLFAASFWASTRFGHFCTALARVIFRSLLNIFSLHIRLYIFFTYSLVHISLHIRSIRDLGSSSSHAATGGFQLSRVHSRTVLAEDSWYQGGLLFESVKRCNSSTSKCPAPGDDNPTPPIALSRFYFASSGRPPGQTGVFSTRERSPTQSSTEGKTATRSSKKSLGRNNPSALWTTVEQIPGWHHTTCPKPSWVEHRNGSISQIG